MFGGGFGGPPIGGGGQPGQPQNGLPFGGIPTELQDGVDRILKTEGEYPTHDTSFSHQVTRGRKPLTLTELCMKYPKWLWGSAVLTVIIAVTSQLGPQLTAWAIDYGLPLSRPHHPAHYHLNIVVIMAVLYALSIIVSSLAQRSSVRVSGRLAASVMNDLRVRVFTHIQRLSLDYFTDEKAGVIMTRMTSDIENLQQLLQDGLLQIAVQVATMVFITIMLFVNNVELALITVLLVVPILTAMSIWFKNASERGYEKVRDGIALVMADLSESLHGVRIVTAHNRQKHNVIAHRNVVGSYRDANNYTGQISAIYAPGSQVLSYVGQAVLLGVGAEMIVHHQIQYGQLFAFFLYMSRFFNPIQLLVQQYTAYQQGQSSILKLRTLLASDPSVLEDADAAELPPVEGRIEFEDVSFSYDGSAPVLHDVNLIIEPGETVAFVGATGAGKSTIAKLITRFYDPTAGRVLIDGHDLRHVTLKSLRDQLGVVPQEPFLFAGTIADNIAFARPDDRDAVVAEAVEKVGLTELVERLPNGVDTVVHERGQSLSSGERQLIALARAFVAQPRVLVLDEATSNLDLQSETIIEGALDVLLQARTAVLIAHRLSTAMRADRIVVVDDGRIAEVGSHDQLVHAGGIYAGMYATWVDHSSGSRTLAADR